MLLAAIESFVDGLHVTDAEVRDVGSVGEDSLLIAFEGAGWRKGTGELGFGEGLWQGMEIEVEIRCDYDSGSEENSDTRVTACDIVAGI